MTRASDRWEMDISPAEAAEEKAHHASVTGADTDPLAAAAPEFQESGVNPFGVFLSERTTAKGLDSSTVALYKTTFADWIDHMDGMDRHPACPTTQHVTSFIDRLLDEGGYAENSRPNSPATVRSKLTKLTTWFRWMQASAEYKHHTTEFNPFVLGRQRREARLESDDRREFPRLDVSDIREVLQDVTHVRSRAIVMLMLKCGLRAGEIRNMEMADLNLSHTDIRNHYTEIGTRPQVSGRENALYIPHGDERDGNKGERPRILPLDRETRDALRAYLLIRPDASAPQVFLTVHGNQLAHSAINRETWYEAFSEYREGSSSRQISSHYGRHFFSNYWDTKLSEEGFPIKYVQYMRGDKISASEFESQSIDAYLRAFYEDIEGVYRDHIFTFGV